MGEREEGEGGGVREASAFLPPHTHSSLMDSSGVGLPAIAFPQGHSLLYNFNDFGHVLTPSLRSFFSFKSTNFLYVQGLSFGSSRFRYWATRETSKGA